MDKNIYLKKISTLLADKNTYTDTDLKTINKSIETFNKSYKNLIKNDKKWASYIEYHPNIPTLYGLPKTHKPDIPMRPIISGIGSATHRIARAIANMLTPLMGTISTSHIKNSGDLLNKIKNINIQNKTMNSLDIISLYTNVPIKKCLNLLLKHLKKINFNLPFPPKIFIEIIRLITDMTYFQFNNNFYKQKFGLPMGNPLSGVLACLFLEFLESGPFKFRLPKDAVYFRYIDDILIFLPENTKIEHIKNKLNTVEPSIKFTHETENNNSIPFLDILIIKSNDNLTFKVHRKTTHKNDYIHFYSHHDNKIKTGMIIGFFLRALRICSSQYLKEEFQYITNSLKTLQYPTYFILNAKKKALQSFSRNNKLKTNTPDTSLINRHLILPTHTKNTIIYNTLNKLRIPTTLSTSQTIRETLKKTRHLSQTPTSKAGIYTIPCDNCNKVYIGETQRELKKRLDEHKRDIKNNNPVNALFSHILQHDHSFNFKHAKLIKFIQNKSFRRLLESALITNSNTIKQRNGFYNLSPLISKIILNEQNINLDPG